MTTLLAREDTRGMPLLNQMEIYLSIVQRKVLMPNDFSSLIRLRHRLLRFQEYYEL